MSYREGENTSERERGRGEREVNLLKVDGWTDGQTYGYVDKQTNRQQERRSISYSHPSVSVPEASFMNCKKHLRL